MSKGFLSYRNQDKTQEEKNMIFQVLSAVVLYFIFPPVLCPGLQLFLQEPEAGGQDFIAKMMHNMKRNTIY